MNIFDGGSGEVGGVTDRRSAVGEIRRRLVARMWTVREELASWDPRLSMALALFRLLPPLVGGRLRSRALRLGGVRVGERTVFAGRLRIGGGRAPASRLSFGVDCFVNDDCRFDTTGPIAVGDDVYLGHEVAVITSSHEVGRSDRRAKGFVVAPVTIGKGSWIGARAMILPGVDIGGGVIVAAGAVVTRNVDDDVMVAGIPARVVRQLCDPEAPTVQDPSTGSARPARPGRRRRLMPARQ
jgi:maltose O-acetyltransferase